MIRTGAGSGTRGGGDRRAPLGSCGRPGAVSGPWTESFHRVVSSLRASMADVGTASKPDFRDGVSLRDLPDGGMLVGRVDAEDALLARRGDALFAVGAHCTHYHGPLADGLIVGDTVRCPWHHACFSLRTGAALRAPALDPIACWRVPRRHQLRRACGALGHGRDRWRASRARLRRDVPARRPHARSRDDRTRRRKPAGRSGDGACRRG